MTLPIPVAGRTHTCPLCGAVIRAWWSKREDGLTAAVNAHELVAHGIAPKPREEP